MQTTHVKATLDLQYDEPRRCFIPRRSKGCVAKLKRF
jgi:hypothetical protein